MVHGASMGKIAYMDLARERLTWIFFEFKSVY